jgi:hypothetical protein
MDRIRGPKNGKLYYKIAVQISTVRMTVWQGADGASYSTNCMCRHINWSAM